MTKHLRLGLNIDHVATLRNARGDAHPKVERAARMAAQCGVDGLTVHLREDRRHIRDHDVELLTALGVLPVNLEIAATEEMRDIALRTRPHAVCIVPEKREEITTEGGLDVLKDPTLPDLVSALSGAGIKVSLFIDPDANQVQAAKDVGAHVVELHTGGYANSESADRGSQLDRLRKSAALAEEIGLEVHAGHGLTFDNVGSVAAIPEIVELNIGHFIVGEAVFLGLPEAIAEMRHRMDQGRAHVLQA